MHRSFWYILEKTFASTYMCVMSLLSKLLSNRWKKMLWCVAGARPRQSRASATPLVFLSVTVFIQRHCCPATKNSKTYAAKHTVKMAQNCKILRVRCRMYSPTHSHYSTNATPLTVCAVRTAAGQCQLGLISFPPMLCCVNYAVDKPSNIVG